MFILKAFSVIVKNNDIKHFFPVRVFHFPVISRLIHSSSPSIILSTHSMCLHDYREGNVCLWSEKNIYCRCRRAEREREESSAVKMTIF